MNRTALLRAGVAGLVVLLASACSQATSSADPVTPPPVTAGSAASSAAPEAKGVSGAEVCGYLEGRLPVLTAIGTEVGAMANLTVNLYAWYEKRGAVPAGTEIDEQTEASCPDVRAAVLKVAGIESFAAL